MEQKKKSKINKSYILLAVVLVILIALSAIKIYVDNDYKPMHDIEYYQSLTNVPVSETDNILTVYDQEKINPYFSVGIIFYSGEKIEGQCYLPLMAQLANSGYHCFLPTTMGNLPILNLDGADFAIRKYWWVTDWYIVAHSTACETAAKYVAGHDNVKGLILLGGTVNTDISNKKIKVLSICGSRDSILDFDKYEKNKSKLPKGTSYKIIEGGNHTAFADTNLIKGDTQTSFKPEKQISITADYIRDFIK